MRSVEFDSCLHYKLEYVYRYLIYREIERLNNILYQDTYKVPEQDHMFNSQRDTGYRYFFNSNNNS